MARTRLTVYQRIVRAAKAARGLRLSAEDASRLARDPAIWGRAELEDAGETQCTPEELLVYTQGELYRRFYERGLQLGPRCPTSSP